MEEIIFNDDFDFEYQKKIEEQTERNITEFLNSKLIYDESI